MQQVDQTATRYDGVTMAFHWATALLIVSQWCIAQMIDWAPRGAPRVPMRSLHLTVGVILLLLVTARLIWRATRGRRLPAADKGVQHVVAKATHWGLYGLMMAVFGLGLALWWLRGDTWFFLWQPSVADPANHDLTEQVGNIHGTLATVILGLAFIHASAAIAHRVLWRDGVLARMFSHKVAIVAHAVPGVGD